MLKGIIWQLSIIATLIQDTAAQAITPDLQDISRWNIINRSAEAINDGGRKAVRLNAAEGDGFLILKGVDFSYGTIEFDVKGKNVVQQSFVGLAFHGQDEKTFEAVYFRPFNFVNPDTARRRRAVQYISHPEHPWEKLRESFPGKYENRVDPVPDPDDWFHVKLDVEAKTVRAYVNNAQKPSLEVERLSGTTKGGLALWVGNNSDGSFANLAITPAQSGTALTSGEKAPYGNNPTAGRYLNAADGTRLYYEVYGQGEPLVLLHGGVYGYIDEFAPFIDKLKENYQVICLATRGHGKSGIGHAPYSYQQRAEDASTIIRTLTKDSVIVLGFSDGGYSGYKLAALYPQLVKKLIAIGAADRPKGGKREKASYTSESLLKGSEGFFKSRLALMPEPERWNESLSKLNHLYNQDFVSSETFRKIQCPVLVLSGDRDAYHQVEAVVAAARMIPKAQLAVIPGCSHVVFHCNFAAVWEAIHPFLKN